MTDDTASERDPRLDGLNSFEDASQPTDRTNRTGRRSMVKPVVLSVLTAIVLMLPGAHPVSAQPAIFDPIDPTQALESWSPEEALSGNWTPEEPVVVPWDPDVRRCELLWARAYVAETRALTVRVHQCPTDASAVALAVLSRNRQLSAYGGSILESSDEITDFSAWNVDRSVISRAWGQEVVGVSFNYTCKSGNSCEADSGTLMSSLQGALPGRVNTASELFSSTGTSVFSALLVMWLLTVGLVRLVAWPFRPRRTFPNYPPQYLSVAGDVRLMRLRRLGRRFASFVLGIFATLTALSILGLQAVTFIICASIAAAAWYARRRLDAPIFHPRRPGRATNWVRRMAGWSLTTVTLVMTLAIAGFIVMFFLTVPFAQTGLWDPASVEQNLEAQGSSTPRVLFFTALSVMQQDLMDAPELWLLFFLPFVVILGFADRFARRLSAKDAAEATRSDTRPHILFLRSFDEDRLRVPASLSRLTLLERISPLRYKRFEEVLARHLSVFGPVVAISPPGTRLPPLGAARTSLSNDEWQEHVHELASSASLIVLSATPTSVREGFLWELELLGSRIAGQPLMLVVPPRSNNETMRRWAGFVSAAAQWPIFTNLAYSVLPTGTLILTSPGNGQWTYWGANRKWDWSYGVAISRALGGLLAPAPNVQADAAQIT